MKRPLLACLLWCSCSSPPPITLAHNPDGFSLSFTPGSAQMLLSSGTGPLLRFPADGLQIGTVPALNPGLSYDPYWLEYGQDIRPPSAPPDLRWHTVQSADILQPTAAQIQGQLGQMGPTLIQAQLGFTDGVSGQLTLTEAAPGHYRALLVPDPGQTGRAVAFVRLRPRAADPVPGEGLYGLGSAQDEVNQRGHVRPMQIELSGTESSDNEAHVPVPLLIGTTGWGIFVESRRVGVFDVMQKEPDLIEITYGTAEQSSAGLSFHLFAANGPLNILRRYLDVTGDPLLPAPWALGPWLWRDDAKDQAQVLDDLQQIRARDLATSGMWLDRPFATAVNSFDFNPAQYPMPTQLIQAVHDSGLGMALWEAPYLEKTAPQRPLADAQGFFPKKSGILLNGWSQPIDFTNPAAYALWQDGVRKYTQAGIAGFKLDYGEDIAPGLASVRNVWEFADGSDERTMHYGYTMKYHSAYAEVLAALGTSSDSGAYLLCRAGRWGDQKSVSVIWPGDMDASFTRFRQSYTPPGDTKPVIGVGGLPATLVLGLSLSASGFPFYAADTGGYRHSPPDNELFIRWFEQTALSTVMNVGDSSAQMPWEFTADNHRDAQTLELYRLHARLHMRLFPYEWTYAQAIRQTGHPIVRPFGLQYPALGIHPWDQYFFGDDLLVAPVITAGATTREVVLPPGDWIGWWDGKVYAGGGGGGSVTVQAPLLADTDPLHPPCPNCGRVPLFLRAGGIIPLLRPTILTIAASTVPGVDSFGNDPGVLWVRLAAGAKPGSFTLYDGTQIQQGPASGARYVHVVQAGQVFQKGVMLEVIHPGPVQTTTVDSLPAQAAPSLAALTAMAQGWFWDPSALGGTLWIKLGPGLHQAAWN